jgi:hypothetical protein
MWEKTHSHSQQSLEFLLDSVASIPGGSAWIIQITARLHSGVFYSSGLILRRNINGVYQRVGILSFAYKNISVLVLKRRWDTITGRQDLGRDAFPALSLHSAFEGRHADAAEKSSSQEIEVNSGDAEERSIVIIWALQQVAAAGFLKTYFRVGYQQWASNSNGSFCLSHQYW